MKAVELGFKQGVLRLRTPPGLVPVLLAAGALCAAVAGAGPERGSAAADRALEAAAFGVTFPLLAFLAAEVSASNARLDRAARGLTRHGLSARLAGAGLALALGAALVAAALLVTACSLFGAYAMTDSRLWNDLARTIPIATLAGSAYAAWYWLASSFGAKGGGRKWFLISDWVFGTTSGWLSLPFPRGHVRNLLGGAPVLELGQSASFGVLLLGTALAVGVGLTRSAD